MSLSEHREAVAAYLRGATLEELAALPYVELKRVGMLAGATVYDGRYKAPTKSTLCRRLLEWASKLTRKEK